MAYSIAGRTDIIDDINQVATITNPDGISLVPSDLETTSLFIRDAVDYLRRGPGETGSLSTVSTEEQEKEEFPDDLHGFVWSIS